MTNLIEFLFTIRGSLIPRNYHYSLYSAIINVIPELKNNPDWRIGRISNTAVFNNNSFRLNNSTLKMRVSKELLGKFSALFDCNLFLNDRPIGIKLIQGYEIKACSDLSAWVTIKSDNNRTPDLSRFAICLGKQLAKLEIETIPSIGRQELLMIKKEPCTVYPVMFSTLRPQESFTLQKLGIGGRQHLGCGFFE